MKRLFAALLLLISPALYAQQLDWTNAVNVPNIVVNPSMNDCVSGAPTCGAWKESGSPLGNWVTTNSNGGALDPDGKQYTFSYMPGMLYQDIDLSQYQTNLFNFTFLFDLNNSCRNFIGGACDRIDGPIDPFSVTLKFYDTNGLNNSFTFLSGNPSTATIGCVGDAEILGLCLLGQNVQDNWQTFGWYSHVQSNGLFTSARLEFTGNDAGFWGGLYGPSVDNALIQINYMPPPYPVSGGGAGMNVSAPGSDYIFIFKGNDPVLFSQLAMLGQDIVGWTALTDGGPPLTVTSVQRPDPDYLFLYTDSNPTSGSWYSFQELPPVTTVNCMTDPFNPQCIIDSLIPDEEPVMLADETTGSDDGSSDGSEVIAEEEDPTPAEEMLAESDPVVEESVDESSPAEESLEELLAEESEEEADDEQEVTAVAAIKEMVNEEKASALSDNISKDVLGAALSIAADAVSAATVAGSESAASSTSSDSSSRSTTLTAATASESATATSETTVITESQSETIKEESVESSALAALEILDTGRQLGQEALAITLASTELSATESLSEAESVSATSSSDSVLASMSSIESAAAVTDDQQVANNEAVAETTTEEATTTETAEISFADNSAESMESAPIESIEQKEETKEEVLAASDVQTQQTTESVAEQKDENVVAEAVSETNVENVEQVAAEVQTEQQSAVEFTTVEEAMEVFASNVNQQAAAEQEELENSIVQQAIASSQSEDENKMGFAEAEAVTIASDPALANAFNIQPNTASLELLGVLSNKPEEKSDAELRAEQVVAANKEQQEAINANYMEADQSGILAAIGSETDVTSYRTAMIRDNNNWYKPEDIYKGVIIKDNVRGSYFLEKGNTDTYKKMVEEQYK